VINVVLSNDRPTVAFGDVDGVPFRIRSGQNGLSVHSKGNVPITAVLEEYARLRYEANQESYRRAGWV